MARTVFRDEAEEFLYAEAALLDAWELDAWLSLFGPAATYEIPSLDDVDGDTQSSQFFIADDMDLLAARVKRLQSKQAHAENPRSRTHRLISNIMVIDVGDSEIELRAAFLIHRLRDQRVDPYLGHYQHRLAVGPDSLKFVRRRAVLPYERLTPASRLSFIV